MLFFFLLYHPIAAPAQAGLARIDTQLDPEEATLPLTALPGLGLPSPLPLPNLQRLYFKILPPVDVAAVAAATSGAAADERGGVAWQELYDDVRHSGAAVAGAGGLWWQLWLQAYWSQSCPRTMQLCGRWPAGHLSCHGPNPILCQHLHPPSLHCSTAALGTNSSHHHHTDSR